MGFVHGADGWRQYTDVTTRETYADQVTLADVQAAANCLIGVALRTPLLAFGPFDDEVGAPRVWLKPENLQPIGAFKIRGAYNALATLSPEEKDRGVVTHSSGNHAQGIARAARMLGRMRAVIVMPDDAPAIKVAGVRADGGLFRLNIARADHIDPYRKVSEDRHRTYQDRCQNHAVSFGRIAHRRSHSASKTRGYGRIRQPVRHHRFESIQ